MESQFFGDPLLELEDFELEQVEEPRKNSQSHSHSHTVFEKIGKLAELVSRPGGSDRQLSDIENLVDKLICDANRVMESDPLQDSQYDFQSPDGGFDPNDEGNYSSRSATVLLKSNNNSRASSSEGSDSSLGERFSLDCLDFHVPVELHEHAGTKSEGAGEAAEDFMSFLVSDPDVIQNVKAEVDEEGDHEIPPPGSYDLVELDAMEILAEHTHFCELCGKGFKRDANLRMHMRGHGDEYKSAAALSKPKDHTAQEQAQDHQQEHGGGNRMKRYSCPFQGCKRHKLHPKFSPLKTVLCVKNHYRRSHCPKMLTCSKCRSKKFSVVADLRTHEKHCGREKWSCSCGTTFSRKDKLMGHVSLFCGHKPLAPGSSSSAQARQSEAVVVNWSQVVFPSEVQVDKK